MSALFPRITKLNRRLYDKLYLKKGCTQCRNAKRKGSQSRRYCNTHKWRNFKGSAPVTRKMVHNFWNKQVNEHKKAVLKEFKEVAVKDLQHTITREEATVIADEIRRGCTLSQDLMYMKSPGRALTRVLIKCTNLIVDRRLRCISTQG